MLRATLADVEEKLAAAGLARVHRSWLLARGHVEAVTPSRSGDFRARLRNGSEVPVSRRYKDAIQGLRAEPRSGPAATSSKSEGAKRGILHLP